VASDEGFASVDNLRWAKAEGIKDVMFSKTRGLSVLDAVVSYNLHVLGRLKMATA